jgi:hypothetical protein
MCAAWRMPPEEKRITTLPALWRQLAKDPEQTLLLGAGTAANLAELLQFWDENDTLSCPRWLQETR